MDRRTRPGRGKLVNDPVLRQFVAGRLKKRWSPEQISQALQVEFPGRPELHLVPETIYQAVYRPELGGLHRELPHALRTGRRRRKPHRRPDARRAGRLVDMTMIDQRPAEAVDRTDPAKWGSPRKGRGAAMAPGSDIGHSPTAVHGPLSPWQHHSPPVYRTSRGR